MAKKKEVTPDIKPEVKPSMTKEQSMDSAEFRTWAEKYRKEFPLTQDNHNPDHHPQGSGTFCVKCDTGMPTLKQIWENQT